MTDEERKARSALDSLDPGSMDYKEWLEIGMALHNGGFPCSLWDEWSRRETSRSDRPTRYHPGVCEGKWPTFTGGNGRTVTMGTLYHLAELHGWTPATGQRVFGWDDVISFDGDGWQDTGDPIEMEKPPDDWNPTKQARDYLTALFEQDDHVAYVVTAYQDADGKWKPHGGICSRTRDQLLQALDRHPDNITDTFGDYNPNAGAWVCFNPVDGEGRNNKNVTGFRYALVESDTQTTGEQLRMIREMRLPARIVVHSGGKSLHAIVRIDARDADEYRQRVEQLHQYCDRHGLEIDKQNKNPSRLSRLPGFDRNGRKQYIVATNLGFPDWASWASWALGDKALPIIRLCDIWDHLPPLKPPIIIGILRRGHKMIITGASKSYKSFLMAQLAICIALGMEWLGHECKPGPVLYLNMEISTESCLNRFAVICKTLGISRPPDNLYISPLRGKAVTMEDLAERIKETIVKAKAENGVDQFAAILIDPIYKLGLGDENSAEAIGRFVNTLDLIAESTGASVIYSHHHSKGAQGAKAALDRGSGSGVFSRDADAILDIMRLSVPGGMQVEYTLREFEPRPPERFFFRYPVFVPDTDGLLEDADYEELARGTRYHGKKGGKKSGEVRQADKADRVALLQQAVDNDVEQTGKRKTQAQYAEQLGVSLTAIKRYWNEIETGE